jgi:MFS transporter, Spinster family, sphingosine-1-phosphate transporter
LLYQAINPINGEETAPELNQIAEAEEGLSEDTVSDSDSGTKKGTCAILWHLKSNVIYMMIVMSLTGLFYIITDIQYWITLYLINNIGVSQSKAQIGFAIICITSPTAGAASSGPLSAYVGGYEHKNALRLGLFLAILSGVIALPIPFIDNFYLIAVNLWFYLYIGGLLVPLMTGTFLANVEVEYRT